MFVHSLHCYVFFLMCVCPFGAGHILPLLLLLFFFFFFFFLITITIDTFILTVAQFDQTEFWGLVRIHGFH